MNTPFKKRANPLAQTVTQTAQQAVPVQETPVQAQPVYTPQPEIQQPVQQPVYTAPVQPVYRQPKAVAVVNHDLNREKYTATMEKDIRRRVKIACATKGVQFSQYVEEAVLEKMKKEGF